MRSADIAWLTVAAGVIAYEACTQDELLSEAMDRYRRRHPWIVSGAVVYVASHLLRCWPQRIDPLHLLATRLR